MNPTAEIASRPMHRLQIIVVALCIALNALDGFDVLAISFAAPGIAAEWGIDRAVLGVVLSMELIGMAVGSVVIGNVADRIGRRPTILGCLLVMAIGMFLAAAASSVTMLSITRLFTGFGIGGMLASTSAMVAEFSNDRRRPLNVVLNIAGYSFGAIVGGMLASILLAGTGDWRTVFLCGGILTTIFLPLAFSYMPESIASQIARRPADALSGINRTLQRLDIVPVDALPPPAPGAAKPSFAALLSPSYAALTILLTLAYFAQIMSFYFIQKWVPKIIVDLGFDAAQAARVLVCANIGGLSGAIILGLSVQRLSLRPVVVGAMLIAFAMITIFGFWPGDLVRLSIIIGLAGFFTNCGAVGLYPMLAQTYPAALRAGGTGFVIGVGRGGSAVGPLLAGALFAAGAGLPVVAMALGSGTLIAALMLVLLPWAQRRQARILATDALAPSDLQVTA